MQFGYSHFVDVQELTVIVIFDNQIFYVKIIFYHSHAFIIRISINMIL